MRLYWPESEGQIDCVGYNHAVSLLRKALLLHIRTNPKDADFRVYCNLPWHHNPKELKKDGLPLLVYTMYESTRVPRSWIRFLNRHAAGVLVPSKWCKNVFLASGLMRPIMVLSLGIDPAECPDCSDFNRPERKKYVYLWQGVAYDPSGRKGVDKVVQAFRELKHDGFLDDEDELILKFRPYESREMIMDSVLSPDGIRYIQSDLPRNRMHDLYKCVDCCVNPTHAEGFGLIPLEQMAMGKPVIVTGYSMPYLEEVRCLTVDYKLQPSPVTWNHAHLVMSRNGASFNIGGLAKEIVWMPKKIAKRPTKDFIALTDAGEIRHTLTRSEWFVNTLINAVASVQFVLGLYRKPRDPVTIFQESPGLDAHVSVQDLKSKMLWCRNNREAAKDMGFLARETALRHWSIDRIREEFEDLHFQKELEQWSK